MKNVSTVLAAGAILCLLVGVALAAQLANSQTLSINDLKGKAIENQDGQKLGTISNFVLDSKSGQTLYAIVSQGGFLGVGVKYTAVPWQAVNYDAAKSTLILNISKDRFHSAPTFTSDNQPDYANADWQQRMDNYFGVQPMQPSGASEHEGTVNSGHMVPQDNTQQR